MANPIIFDRSKRNLSVRLEQNPFTGDVHIYNDSDFPELEITFDFLEDLYNWGKEYRKDLYNNIEVNRKESDNND